MTRPAPSSSTAADPTADHPPGDTEALRRRCGGLPRLSARLEPWMRELLADRRACSALIEEYGSPVNVHEFSALARNASELESAAARHGVPLRVFVARKANKTLGLVESARRAGHGVDVGSHRELSQVLDQGYAPEDVVVTAAVKPPELLRLAREASLARVVGALATLAVIGAAFWLAEPLFRGLGNFNLVIFFVGVVAVAVFTGVPIAFAFGLAVYGYLALTPARR